MFNVTICFYIAYDASKCNLMTGDDTLCRVCRVYYFLFLLSAQSRMFNVKMK